ncbi:NAD(P)-dependent oxidoreductase [bacterium]|jgi:CDP-paratose synthetase|nr:NAD(P)-dependent oxidoreductase [bacterium]MBT3580774.1 NAD(P)-dependent oxidoreductase [bacterium]MBT4551625.1 NAD(P)-dependent oxidoreductase [bacterium]MBT5988743.1 NAD(P)-dependent oxidoreductase [bacterium]MBT7088614.1 NAD(P)-dependent oxidoreductase [bacterium]
MKKNILLTGATGFLGSNLLKALLQNEYNVIILKRSFSNIFRIESLIKKVVYYDVDKIDLHKIFQENKIDIIIHCATSYGRKKIEPLSTLDANLVFPLNLLELGTKYGVKAFLNTDTILDKRINYYSLSKNQFKDWLKMYSNKLVCINIVLEHFYGPNDDNSKFVTFIINSLLMKPVKIDLTEGDQIRDFIYIDDVVNVFIVILKNIEEFKQNLYNLEVGTNKPISIKSFVKTVKKIIGNHKTLLNFGALPYRRNEIMSFKTNTEAIRDLGWVPKISLEEGLKKTMEVEKEKIRKEKK